MRHNTLSQLGLGSLQTSSLPQICPISTSTHPLFVWQIWEGHQHKVQPEDVVKETAMQNLWATDEVWVWMEVGTLTSRECRYRRRLCPWLHQHAKKLLETFLSQIFN